VAASASIHTGLQDHANQQAALGRVPRAWITHGKHGKKTKTRRGLSVRQSLPHKAERSTRRSLPHFSATGEVLAQRTLPLETEFACCSKLAKRKRGYWIELATLENALLALVPMSRTVPTTITRMTANMTAYSAMS
jgi:hypothetical protein